MSDGSQEKSKILWGVLRIVALCGLLMWYFACLARHFV